MQIGNFMIPFTKPSQPTLWIDGGGRIELEELTPSTLIVKSSAGSFATITLVFRSLGVLFGVCVMLAPLGAIAVEFVENMSLDDKGITCNTSLSGLPEYVEFENGDFSCLENYDDSLKFDNFEVAEQHFKIEYDDGWMEEYRWSQQSDTVDICMLDRYYDAYFSCTSYVRVTSSMQFGNVSDYWYHEDSPGPEWVNDKPSTVSVDYATPTQSLFEGDLLAVSYDPESGQIMTLEYTSKSLTYHYYGNPIDRTIADAIVPFLFAGIFGAVIIAIADGRRPYLVFDLQNSVIHRKVRYGSPLSKYTWVDVRFATFELEPTTREVHHSGGEDSQSYTSYHEGFDISFQHQNSRSVFMFLEGSRVEFSKFTESLMNAIGFEAATSTELSQEFTESNQPTVIAAERPLPTPSMANESQEIIPQSKNWDSTEKPVNQTTSFWDEV
tara:strand:- start:2286 stop:3602 length:1317 start_codon:yes stop_codon:yes gene_type:complete